MITLLLTTAMLAAVLVPGAATAQEDSQQSVARVFHCGLVKAYTPPDGTRGEFLIHTTEGSITVGEKTLAIAAGAQTRSETRPDVGEGTCLDGRLSTSGALVSYAGLGMPPTCQTGDLARYEPATATSDGMLRFAMGSDPPFTSDSWVFRIPAGTVLPDDVADPEKRYCFYVFDLDSEGRAFLSRVEDHTAPEETAPAQPGGRDRGSTGGPRQLPSTSTR